MNPRDMTIDALREVEHNTFRAIHDAVMTSDAAQRLHGSDSDLAREKREAVLRLCAAGDAAFKLIEWALGEGDSDFPPRPVADGGPFYWRAELRRRRDALLAPAAAPAPVLCGVAMRHVAPDATCASPKPCAMHDAPPVQWKPTAPAAADAERVMQRAHNDCMRACVATLFAVSLDDVPDLHEGDWIKTLREWSSERGFTFLSSTIGNDTFHEQCSRGTFIVAGKSPRGVTHAVIYRDGKLWHDPHPEGGGIEKVEAVDLFVPFDSPKKLRQPAPAPEAPAPVADPHALARRELLAAKHEIKGLVVGGMVEAVSVVDILNKRMATLEFAPVAAPSDAERERAIEAWLADRHRSWDDSGYVIAARKAHDVWVERGVALMRSAGGGDVTA